MLTLMHVYVLMCAHARGCHNHSNPYTNLCRCTGAPVSFRGKMRSTRIRSLSCEKALRLAGSGLGIGSCVSAVCTVCVCGCCGCCRRSRSDTHVHTQVVDLSQTSCHGKSYADGASNVPTCHLRQAAKSGEAVAPGTRGLVLFLADKMREPSSPKDGRWMSVDEYLVAYYPVDCFDESRFKCKEGYEGSSKDHFYSNSGLHRLASRYLRCVSSKCVNDPRLFSESCLLSPWCGVIRHHNLVPGTSGTSDRVHTRREIFTLEEFAETLGAMGSPCDRVVACVVHEDDENELDEPFYLARPVSKARRIDKDCLIGGNEYKKGHLVVNVKWYCYVGSSRGDRIYQLQPGCSKGVVYSVQSIIKDLVGIRFKHYENGKYTLSRDSVKTITNYVKWLTK